MGTNPDERPGTRFLEAFGALAGEIEIGDDFEFSEAELDEMIDPPDVLLLDAAS